MAARELTTAERAVLVELLGRDFAGADELRRQLAAALVEPSCQCGCGSIRFVFPDEPALARSESPNPVPVAVTILAADRSPVGGIVVFLRDGLLCDAEVFSFLSPLPWPNPAWIQWDE